MKTWTLFLSCAAVSVALAMPSASAYEVNRKKNEITLSSIADFEKCIRDYGDYQVQFCVDGLTKYIQGHKKDAFEAGKLARLNLKHWAALPFFDIASSTVDKKKFCADEDVHLATVSGLGLPPGSKNEDKLIHIAETIAFDRCWDTMKEALNKEIDSGTGYLRDNACLSLKKKHVAQKSCDTPAVAEAKPAPDAVDPEVAKLAQVDTSKLEVAEAGVKVFKGDEGRKITIVRVLPEDSNRVLIKFEGFKGPWNGKSLLHLERDMGNNRADYVAFVDGKGWVTIAKRDSYGSANYEVYPKGDNGSYRVSYSEEHSEKASAKNILKDFQTDIRRGVAGK
jgi:hypothetical protein